MRLQVLSALFLSAIALSGCGITTPEDNTKDNVSGVIEAGGSSYHVAQFKRNGEVQVTVTSLSPTPSASIGMGIGLEANSTCTPLTGYVAAVVVNRVTEFGYLQRGSYCLLFYDTGVITTSTSYTAIFSHP